MFEESIPPKVCAVTTLAIALQQKQKRQKSAQRAFAGRLVGLPQDEPVTVAPAAPVETPVATTPPLEMSKRRGRPRVHANAAEKRKVEEAKRIIEQHPDHRGRLHDETSGGYGKKKIEQVVAASQREFKKKKMGAKPDKFEYELDELYNSKKQREQKDWIPGRVAQNWELSDSEKNDAIAKLADYFFKGDEVSGENLENPSTLRCELCGTVVDFRAHTLRHFEEEYQKALKARERYSIFIETRELLNESFLASAKAACDNPHSRMIEQYLLELSPKKTPTKKRTKCSSSIHRWYEEQARVRKDPEQLHCKVCGKVVYTPNFAAA